MKKELTIAIRVMTLYSIITIGNLIILIGVGWLFWSYKGMALFENVRYPLIFLFLSIILAYGSSFCLGWLFLKKKEWIYGENLKW